MAIRKKTDSSDGGKQTKARTSPFLYYHGKIKSTSVDDTLLRWQKMSMEKRLEIVEEYNDKYHPKTRTSSVDSARALAPFNCFYSVVKASLAGVFLINGTDVKQIAKERFAKLTPEEKHQYDPYAFTPQYPKVVKKRMNEFCQEMRALQ